jgi:predicted nuclease with RNAse H fold
MTKTSTYFGIDYGSKYTGNTVIAVLQGSDIMFMQVDKKVDADNFIINAAEHFKPEWIFLDAPLSLPGVYTNTGNNPNYHFRKADLECKAMSPMFLGGLAARAIELKDKLQSQGMQVFETYPRIMAKRLALPEIGYKKSKSNLSNCTAETLRHFKNHLSINPKDINTWHHLDALLALMSAMAHEQDQCTAYGDPKEGQILV